MPLVAGGELVGLVDLYDDAERDWSADIASLASVCQLVAGVFDSTALLDEARETVRLREELVELGAALAVAETTQEIAELAAARLRDAATELARTATSGGCRRATSAVSPAWIPAGSTRRPTAAS